MSLTLELPPEVETRLVEEAARRGLPVSEIVSLLVQGYFWPAESSLITEWYRQESRRGLFAIRQKQAEIEQRERLVEALTKQKNIESQIAHEERAIIRCEREAVLAAQKEERADALKAYQTKVLHEQRRNELKLNLPDAAAITEKLSAELRDRGTNVLSNVVEQTRMRLQRNRADILLGKPACQHIVEYELEARIRKYASEAVWNAQYAEWIAAHGDTVPDEAPSEIEVMQQVGEQNQQLLNKQIQRLEELLNAAKPSEQEPSE